MEIIAHRTNSKVYLPNSVESLQFLVAHGIRAVEFDVCKSNSGRLVVAHPGLVKKDELEAAISLMYFLKICKSANIDVFVDIKFTDFMFDHRFLDSVKETIFEIGMRERSVIISQSEDILSQFRDNVAIGYITSDFNPSLFYSYDKILVPVLKLKENIDPFRQWIHKIVITDVEITSARFAQKLKPYAIMTDYAVEIKRLVR